MAAETTLVADELSDLALRAAEGDSRAAARFFQLTLPWLMGAARRIAPYLDRAEHEDMVADAWAKLVAQWKVGRTPKGNPRSYLAETMRNAFTDRLRSPAHRVGAIEPEAVERAPELRLTDESAVRPAELHREARLVREAFATLNPDFQLVLQRVLIDGAPPRELTDELGRPSSAVSSLLNRAKHSLRRAVLIQHIEAKGVAECSANAQILPERVKDRVEDHDPRDRGLAHVLGCADCRASWGRFASMTSALGITTLLIVDDWSVRAGGYPNGADPNGADPNGADPNGIDQSGADPSAAQVPKRWQEASGDPSASAARVDTMSTAVSGPAEAVSALTTTWVGIAVVGALAIGGAGVVVGVVNQQGVAPPAVPSAAPVETVEPLFEAWAEADGGPNGALEVVFDLPGVKEWSVQQLSLQLPSGVTLASSPAGVDCSGASPVVCVPASWPSGGAPVRLDVTAADGAVLTGGFAATLTAFVPLSGQTVTAKTAGDFAQSNAGQ